MPARLPANTPTHAEIAAFIQGFLPPQANVNEVPLLFHTPRHPLYAPERQRTLRLIFSVTPTAAVYKALNDPDVPQAPVCFLHRPWTLDRRHVRRGSVVFASHNAFDANLTVGWNEALASRLALRLDSAICIQGYKGDPERKIGLVAQLREPAALGSLAASVSQEFAGAGQLYAPSEADQRTPDGRVEVVAIMNAFHQDEIDRVLEATRVAGWIRKDDDGRRLLYLTGAARDYGLEAAGRVTMPAYCVGHRACEEWGIRYLVKQARLTWPALEVVEVLEEEEKQPRREDVASESEGQDRERSGDY